MLAPLADIWWGNELSRDDSPYAYVSMSDEDDDVANALCEAMDRRCFPKLRGISLAECNDAVMVAQALVTGPEMLLTGDVGTIDHRCVNDSERLGSSQCARLWGEVAGAALGAGFGARRDLPRGARPTAAMRGRLGRGVAGRSRSVDRRAGRGASADAAGDAGCVARKNRRTDRKRLGVGLGPGGPRGHRPRRPARRHARIGAAASGRRQGSGTADAGKAAGHGERLRNRASWRRETPATLTSLAARQDAPLTLACQRE